MKSLFNYFFFLVFFSSISFGFDFEYGIIPLLIVFIYSFKDFNVHKVNKFQLFFLLYAFLSFLTIYYLYAYNLPGFKLVIQSFFFILAISFGFERSKNLNSTVKLLFTFMLLFDILDLSGLLNSVKSFMFARPVYSFGFRGASGFFSEPSYNALAVLCLSLITDNEESDLWRIHFPFILSILTFSTMAIFPLAIVLARINFRWKIFYLIIGFMLINYFNSRFRIFSVISLLLNDYEQLLLDNSFSSRLSYILRDLFWVFDNQFIPIWPGSYGIFVLDHPADTLFYNPLLAGSLFGYWIVQLGIFLCFIVLHFITFNKGNRFERLILILASFQMISLSFVLVPFTIGYLWKRK